MATQRIESLFACDVRRSIEEVIKVDQVDEKVLADEIDEYVVTRQLDQHFERVLDHYLTSASKPTEGVGIWVAGFFGSGKSSFAKMLGLAISNRPVMGTPAAERFSRRPGSDKVRVLLKQITERLPTHAVIFDVSTDRGIRSGNQTLTEIMYRLLLGSLGYARDLDLSSLEISLEGRNQLDAFKDEYRRLENKEWDAQKNNVAFALNEASQVMHRLDSKKYPMADSWVKAAQGREDITPGLLAERATELLDRRKPGHRLLFVVDEVGQFVARDVQKMLDLQAIVQNLGTKGRGRHWLVVTSQERLDELVSGLDDRRVELARLLDRFPTQVSLEPSDIAEVTSRRVLSKKAEAEGMLGKLLDDNKGRLENNTRVTGVGLPELTRAGFIDLYPLLPYQVELIIRVVSGLRTKGGTFVHVGGANRTIIKLAQQLLVNPGTNLADQPVGALARIDQVYDLVEGSIASEIRAKIAAITRDHADPMPARVAKAVCLLQYVKSIPRSADNIAAVLQPAVTADSQLTVAKAALHLLESEQRVRQGDDGYRIPTPAEDDWAKVRMSLSPRPGDVHRIHGETLVALWQPAPTALLADTKNFKAGLVIHGKAVAEGDLAFHFHLAEDAKAMTDLSRELRARSQQEAHGVFWAVQLSPAIDRETVELFRSREMIARKEREARTADEVGLVAEEKARFRTHVDELRRLLEAACLAGSVYFRGQPRDASEAASVGKAATDIMSRVLPEVFDRFKEAAAKVADAKKGLEALLAATNLHGLPPTFAALRLLRDEQGHPVFRTDGGPLQEVMNRIDERANYGDPATGRWLATEFEKEPFGWDFEVVRLLVACLLGAGKIKATSKSNEITTITGVEANKTFTDSNLFRQASFRPQKGIEFEELAKAAEAFRDTFGSEVKNLTPAAVAADIRQEATRHEETVAAAIELLRANSLAGTGVLDSTLAEIKLIRRGGDDGAISAFNAAHRSIKEGIHRAGELEKALTEPRLRDLREARRAMTVAWPFLATESDVDPEVRASAEELDDLLRRETFFRELPFIEQRGYGLLAEYNRRHEIAMRELTTAYDDALGRLHAAPGWPNADQAQQARLEAPLRRCIDSPHEGVSVPQLRAEREACESRLRKALAELDQLLEGDRLATLNASSFFSGGVETEEQLDEALKGLREECARLIGAGKKVVVR